MKGLPKVSPRAAKLVNAFYDALTAEAEVSGAKMSPQWARRALRTIQANSDLRQYIADLEAVARNVRRAQRTMKMLTGEKE